MNRHRALAAARTVANRVLGAAGVRLVNRDWGPRGFEASFARARELGFRPRQIVDAGASDGKWTRACLSLFPDARYLLVDPLSENRPALDALASEHANVVVWQGALGAAAGSLSLHVHGDQSSPFASEWSTGAPGRIVEVRTLDSFLDAGMAPPDLIKADVQGCEIEILKGARRCLAHAELLLLEVSFRRLYQDAPLAHEVIAASAAAGFRIWDICTYGQRPSDGAFAQSDLVFAAGRSKLFEPEGWGSTVQR